MLLEYSQCTTTTPLDYCYVTTGLLLGLLLQYYWSPTTALLELLLEYS